MKAAAAIISLSLALPAFAADRFVLDPGHTYPNFLIDHMGFSLMHGRFNETAGEFVMDRDGGTSSLAVVIQAASIDTGHDKRDEHLRKADFFDVETHPTLEYRSTKISFTGESTASIDGELTMLGQTRPVTLTVDSIRCGVHAYSKVYVCGFNATGRLKRSDFGMSYGLANIGDDVELRIEAEGARQETRRKGAGPR